MNNAKKKYLGLYSRQPLAISKPFRLWGIICGRDWIECETGLSDENKDLTFETKDQIAEFAINTLIARGNIEFYLLSFEEFSEIMRSKDGIQLLSDLPSILQLRPHYGAKHYDENGKNAKKSNWNFFGL